MQAPDVTQAPESSGFEAQIAPHLPALSALAWRFTHNTAMAQDLVQDTLLKAFRFFHRFESGTNMWAWLMTIMRNLYFSQIRKKSLETVMVDPDHMYLISEHSVVPEPEVSRAEDLTTALPHLVTDDVLHALEDLPEEYRTAVLMAHLLDHSYKDIATAMGCPIGTVMSRLHRGRQMLQKRLQAYAADQGYIRAADQDEVDPAPAAVDAPLLPPLPSAT